MASFTKIYTYYLGDLVGFRIGNMYHQGVVQCVSQMPDIWVECVEGNVYKRYCVGINCLELIYSEHKNSGVQHIHSFEKNERMEFVRGGDLGTPEFNEKTYKQ